MIKKTLCFTNRAFLSLKLGQLVIRRTNAQGAEETLTRPIEDIDVHIARVNKIVPHDGKVCIIKITERQFNEILLFEGKKEAPPPPISVQLELGSVDFNGRRCTANFSVCSRAD